VEVSLSLSEYTSWRAGKVKLLLKVAGCGEIIPYWRIKNTGRFESSSKLMIDELQDTRYQLEKNVTLE
jgi:hypothetical protein